MPSKPEIEIDFPLSYHWHHVPAWQLWSYAVEKQKEIKFILYKCVVICTK